MGPPPEGVDKCVVLPAFVNAHTHLGDAGAYPAPKIPITELVAPPDGYKHRTLRSMDRGRKVSAIRDSIQLMMDTGTSEFCDFREEGIEGIRCLKEALRDSDIRARILGRPSGDRDLVQELSEIMRESDGIGMSGIGDLPFGVLSKASLSARTSGKVFSIHASEVQREDIDKILELKPSSLIHMTHATERDLLTCAEEGVPVVVCPLTYEFFGIGYSIRRMLDSGLTVALGTDNAMISRPDMLEASKAAYRSGSATPREALHLAVFGGRKVLYANAQITTDIAHGDDFVAIRVKGEDPLLELVTAADSEDIVAVVNGRRERRRHSWMR